MQVPGFMCSVEVSDRSYKRFVGVSSTAKFIMPGDDKSGASLLSFAMLPQPKVPRFGPAVFIIRQAQKSTLHKAYASTDHAPSQLAPCGLSTIHYQPRITAGADIHVLLTGDSPTGSAAPGCTAGCMSHVLLLH